MLLQNVLKNQVDISIRSKKALVQSNYSWHVLASTQAVQFVAERNRAFREPFIRQALGCELPLVLNANPPGVQETIQVSRKQFSKGGQADVDAQGGQCLPFDAIAAASDADRRALGQPVLLKRGGLCVQHHPESSCVQRLVVRWTENTQCFDLPLIMER